MRHASTSDFCVKYVAMDSQIKPVALKSISIEFPKTDCGGAKLSFLVDYFEGRRSFASEQQPELLRKDCPSMHRRVSGSALFIVCKLGETMCNTGGWVRDEKRVLSLELISTTEQPRSVFTPEEECNKAETKLTLRKE